MKTSSRLLTALLISGAIFATTVQASDLRVAPVMLDPLPGSRSAALTILNEEQRPLKVQIRVMRWTQENGQDVLTPTQDVVVSPPFSNLAPGQHYLVRVVRTARAAPVGEESYRIVVDEVPDAGAAQPGTVNLVLRQIIPVFFTDETHRVSVVDWTVAREGEEVFLVAHNRGNRRLRLSDVVIEGSEGVVFNQNGLVGYVLPGATMRWPVTANASIVNDTSLHLRAVSDTGLLEVPLVDAPAA